LEDLLVFVGLLGHGETRVVAELFALLYDFLGLFLLQNGSVVVLADLKRNGFALESPEHLVARLGLSSLINVRTQFYEEELIVAIVGVDPILELL